MTRLLVTEVFPPRIGGSGSWLWELYRRMPGGSVVVAAGETLGQEEFDNRADLRISRIPLTFSSWGLMSRVSRKQYGKAIRPLSRVIHDDQVDQVDCARCLPEGLMGLWFHVNLGIPYSCFVHGEELMYAKSSRELSWLMRQVFHHANRITANSRSTATILANEWSFSHEKILVSHPGVDTDVFRPAEREASLREVLGWGDRSVVLTVGRLQKRKGHDVMIRSIRAITREIPNLLYAVVGDGEEMGNLQALAVQEGVSDQVCFHGALGDQLLKAAYQQADLFVLPNRLEGKDFEGFGIVLLEAQACGRPVVAGQSGGTSETMDVGKTGFVVDCSTPEELSSTISGLLGDQDRLELMGCRARAWVVENFDWERLAGQFAEDCGLRAQKCPASSSSIEEFLVR